MPAVSGRFWLRACLAVGAVGIGLGSLRACDLSQNLDALARNVKAATAQEAARAAGEIDANLRRRVRICDAKEEQPQRTPAAQDQQ